MRRVISDSVNPVILTIFLGEVLPETTFTCCLEIPSTSAMIFSTATFALLPSGGVVTRTLRISPSRPARQLREDAGTTLMVSFIFEPRFEFL